MALIVTDVLVEHFGEYVDVRRSPRAWRSELDEVARGEREWVPLLREFYDPLMELVDEKRKELKRAELTTERADEVCSEGHPMVIRLGRNGRFLACSMYPEHKETRPIPGEEPETAHGRGRGRALSQVRRGRLVAKRGASAPSPVAPAIPTATTSTAPARRRPRRCPSRWRARVRRGQLVARRARRTGNVF